MNKTILAVPGWRNLCNCEINGISMSFREIGMEQLGCLGIYSEGGVVGAKRYEPKEKNHGLKNPRCTGIYLLGYCGKCIKNKQEEKKHESIGNKFQPHDG
jgi:hypothetical protein